MPDRHSRRRDALRQTVATDGCGAILVSTVVNVGYLTGFSGDSTALIVMADRDLAVSDFRYAEQLQNECPDVPTHIRPVNQKLWAAVADAVGKLGIGNLAFEANGMFVSDHDTMRAALPGVATRGVIGRVEALRAIKDEEEIATIRRAILAAERAFAMFRAGLRLDESEIDAADGMEHYLRRCGSSAAAFEPIVAAGPGSALPHARPAAAGRIGDSDFLLVDWGAIVEGYRSDLTRMLVTAKVGTEFARVYRAVLAAQERAIATIRPGARASEVDAVARAAIDEAGFGGLFGHGLGHGIGLAIHESPWLRPDSDDVLRPGMVLTVEPGIYRTGWGGIRIEDDVLVTPDGAEILTSVPKAIETLSPY
ncbi:MAG: Xaa-Pro aminopeptidase [Planctomycetota bacterium]|nr:Xaa-Pro aminopeptidase [Planctomycetota bacterium]